MQLKHQLKKKIASSFFVVKHDMFHFYEQNRTIVEENEREPLDWWDALEEQVKVSTGRRT